jgi:hypothetical protein
MNRALNANLAVEDPDTNGLYEWCNLRAGRMSSLGGLGPNSLHPERDPHPDDGRGLLMHADLDMNGYTLRNVVLEEGVGGDGEINIGENIGEGQGLYAGKVGVKLQFKKLVGGQGIDLVSGPENVAISVNTTNLYENLDGFVYSSPGSGLDALKTRLDATVDPTPTDDGASGYAIGSRWLNIVSDREFVCTSSSIGNAKWIATTSSFVASTDPQIHWDAIVVGSSGNYGEVDGAYTFETLQEAVTNNKYSIRVLDHTNGATLQSNQAYDIDVSAKKEIQTPIIATGNVKLRWTGGYYRDLGASGQPPAPIIPLTRWPIVNQTIPLPGSLDWNITLENVTILTALGDNPQDVENQPSNWAILFRRCSFTEPIKFYGCQGKFENCIFDNNVFCNRDWAGAVATSTSFQKCYIRGNLEYGYGGILLVDKIFNECLITDNEITGNLIIDENMDVSYLTNNIIGGELSSEKRIRETHFTNNRIGDTLSLSASTNSERLVIDSNIIRATLSISLLFDCIITNNIVERELVAGDINRCSISGNRLRGTPIGENDPISLSMLQDVIACDIVNNVFENSVISTNGSNFVKSIYSGNAHPNAGVNTFAGDVSDSVFSNNQISGPLLFTKSNSPANSVFSGNRISSIDAQTHPFTNVVAGNRGTLVSFDSSEKVLNA